MINCVLNSEQFDSLSLYIYIEKVLPFILIIVLLMKILRLRKREKTVIGHSLGGGLATAVSMKYNIPAVTFNPAA